MADTVIVTPSVANKVPVITLTMTSLKYFINTHMNIKQHTALILGQKIHWEASGFDSWPVFVSIPTKIARTKLPANNIGTLCPIATIVTPAKIVAVCKTISVSKIALTAEANWIARPPVVVVTVTEMVVVVEFSSVTVVEIGDGVVTKARVFFVNVEVVVQDCVVVVLSKSLSTQLILDKQLVIRKHVSHRAAKWPIP